MSTMHQHKSATHDLAAEWTGDTDDPVRVIGPGGDEAVSFPWPTDWAPSGTGLQFRALAVGFFNQLQRERKSRGLMAYHKDDPETDAYVEDREAKRAAAVEAAAENYGMA